MQRDGDGDGALRPQGGHGSLRLALVPGGFDPRAAQVGQLVELDAVLLRHRRADGCHTRSGRGRTCLNRRTFGFESGVEGQRGRYKRPCAGRVITELQRMWGGEGVSSFSQRVPAMQTGS